MNVNLTKLFTWFSLSLSIAMLGTTFHVVEIIHLLRTPFSSEMVGDSVTPLLALVWLTIGFMCGCFECFIALTTERKRWLRLSLIGWAINCTFPVGIFLVVDWIVEYKQFFLIS